MNHNIFMHMAIELAVASKCLSKKVGCLLVLDGRILSTGVNGAVSGNTNCCDKFNGTMPEREVHHEWSNKYEIHAEMNSIIWAARNGISLNNASCYCTLQPCWNCLKHLAAAGIKNIYYGEKYDMNIDIDDYTDFVIKNFNNFKELGV